MGTYSEYQVLFTVKILGEGWVIILNKEHRPVSIETVGHSLEL